MRVLVLLGIVGAMVSPAWGIQLITNGTFDNGLNGWTFDVATWGNFGVGNVGVTTGGVWGPSTHTNDPAYYKSYSGAVNGNQWLYQVVTGLTIGTQYTLSADMFGGVGNAQPTFTYGEAPKWRIGYKPGGYDYNSINTTTNGTTDVGTQLYPYASGAAAPNNGWGFDWTHPTATFTATDTTYTIYFKYGCSGGNENYFGAGVDNFSLTPEPASLILLAVSLPLLRRRR